MFENRPRETHFQSALAMGELIFHASAHAVRKTHNNAIMSILLNLIQIAIMLVVFYLLYTLLGMKTSAIRGDFVLYMLSGIFLYVAHVRTLSAVAGADGPTSPMMQHAPMNTLISMAAGAISALYIQALSLIVILFLYYVTGHNFTIYQPMAAFGCLMISWFYGIAVGIVFAAAMPWAPDIVGILRQFYTRMNMIFSGKMVVANTLPPKMHHLFDWNPLFHTIDQARGYIFINYEPQTTSLKYAMWVAVAIFALGLIGEFYTRRNASASWGAKR